MAREKASTESTKRPGAARQSGGERESISAIGEATSQIVKEAAALLDQELAAGIVAAKKVQARLETERRIDPKDLSELLHRLQGDAHEVVNLLEKQVSEMGSEETASRMQGLTKSAHDLIDVASGFVSIATEIAGQVIEQKLPKRGDKGPSGAG